MVKGAIPKPPSLRGLYSVPLGGEGSQLQKGWNIILVPKPLSDFKKGGEQVHVEGGESLIPAVAKRGTLA